MSTRYKILVSVLAVVLGFVAAGMGFSLVGAADFSFQQKFLYNFVFSTQFFATVWVVAAVFRKNKP